MALAALRVIPILRVFSVEKAREFYLDDLGFQLDREHRFDDNAPLYIQIQRVGLVLHLSEHYGDSSPGTQFQVNFTGVRELHAELAIKGYRYLRPGITETFWGTPQLRLTDPFGNRINLCEPEAEAETGE